MAFGSDVLEVFNAVISSLPLWAQNFVNLFLLVLVVFVYVLFIWKFYHLIARKNILQLNLNKYNRSQHPGLVKFVAAIFYLLEYIIILPFLIFFWFAVFTFLLILLTESLDVGTLLIVSATIIAAIRMTSYYNQDLSKDLAKMLPLTLLAVSILNPGFLDIERIFAHLGELPNFFSDILYYLLFIVLLEIILRVFYFLFSIIGLHEEKLAEKGDTGEEKA